MDQLLQIASVVDVKEVEPAIYEIIANLGDGTKARLRLNAFTLQSLAQQVASHLTL